MVKLLYAVTVAILGMIPATAMAADDFIDGVYLKSAQLCQDAKDGKLQKLIEGGQMVLSTRGFDTVESNCAFVQVLKHPRIAKAWVVTAFCEAPGYTSPDTLTIIQHEAGKLDVSSLAEGYTGPIEDDPSSAGGDEAPSDGTDSGTADGTAAATDGSDLANSGISGTYFHCDGVTMP